MTTPPSLYSKRPRLKGARGKGISYENKVGARLRQWQERGELVGDIMLGQWFAFEDENGFGCCQPDILVVTDSLVFILECKLTQCEEAWRQLRSLYKPVVETVFQRPSITIQVCKHLRYMPAGMVESIAEVMDSPKDGNLTWHFLG